MRIYKCQGQNSFGRKKKNAHSAGGYENGSHATKVILAAKEKYGKFFTLERAMIYLDFAHNDFCIPKGNIPQVKEAMPDAWAALGLPAGE